MDEDADGQAVVLEVEGQFSSTKNTEINNNWQRKLSKSYLNPQT